MLDNLPFEEPEKVPVSNSCKHHKPDVVGRPGRLVRAEKRYRGNSSMAPRKDHSGKGKTLRDKRK